MLMLLENSRVNFIFDADCLTVMAGNLKEFSFFSNRIVITPHLGEMSRLCGKSIPEIAADKEKCAAEFSKKTGFTTLIKGNNTAVAAPDGRIYINTTGNPYMARGGSGDVLTGMIGSFLAQGIELFDAVCLGAYLHGGAGDVAAKELGLSMLPSDIPERIGKFLFSK
jgi:NAD(P)H-hydrate epimerase